MGAPQAVPFVAVHEPAPSQSAATQPDTFNAQVLCGSCPARTLVHVPTLPVTLHALQPLHVLEDALQQNPSTQLPETHWFPPRQAEPFPYFPTHVPPTWQKFSAAQSPSAAHELKHVVLPGLQT